MVDVLLSHPLAWSLFAGYLVVTFALAWIGHRRTKSFEDFAVGGRSMGPGIAGVTLGACLASTATFVITPGFVYQYGLPALISVTIPLFAGVLFGLFVLGPGFRRLGAKAWTLPAWIGERYQSPGLRVMFAGLSLLHVFYAVLIVVGAAYVMSATMGVSYQAAVLIVVGVVFSYVMLGGTYAHAYTNTAQGAVMLAVSAVIFGFALKALGSPGAAIEALRAQEPKLLALTDPASPFYRNPFEVLVCPFVMGVAIVAQPHLLLKTLYLKDGKDLARFSLTGLACFVVFSLVLFGGLAARVELGPGIRQDQAMSQWLAGALPSGVGAVVSVAILAAAMSTLDGILVAISSIVGSDLLAHPRLARRFGFEGDEGLDRAALWGGRAAVLVIGLAAVLLSWSPPKLVLIFGTAGTYGLLVASLPAILYGVLLKRPPSARAVIVGAALGLALHAGLYWRVTINTGLTATLGLFVALGVTGGLALLERRFASGGDEDPSTAARADEARGGPPAGLALASRRASA